MATTTAGAAAAAAAHARQRSRSKSQNQVLNDFPAPAGFETLYVNERSRLTTSFEAFVLPLHWALVRGGLRLRVSEANPTSNVIQLTELTEGLPSNWPSKITSKPEEGTEQQLQQLVLRYWDHSNASVHYEAKVLEVVKNNAIVVILFRAVNAYGADGNVQVANKVDMDSNSPSRNSSASNFQVGDYITAAIMNTSEEHTLSPVVNKQWNELYKNLQGLERNVWEMLMDPIGLMASGKGRHPGPFENKIPAGQEQNQAPPPQPYTPMVQMPPPMPMLPYPTGGIGGPLYAPPALPVGGGGLGRSDLDPLGGFGTGNVADPRGFRAPPALPYGGGFGGAGGVLPPNARFDPFGPPNPAPPGVPRPLPGGGTAGGGNNWGVPTPDAEQPPPGFDDMFM